MNEIIAASKKIVEVVKKLPAGLVIVPTLVIIALCCGSAIDAAKFLARTPTPTVNVPALTTKIAKTLVAAAGQTDQAKPTQTPIPTIAFTPTITDTPAPASTVAKTSTATRAATSTTAPFPTQAPTEIPPAGNCNPAYPDLCLTYDMTCTEIGVNNFRVLPPDPYGLDRDGDGVGCEKN